MSCSSVPFFVVAVCIGAMAQDECSASGSLVMGGSENFDFCTSVLGVDVFWNYNPNDAVPNVDVLVQADNDGWHAFGFSSGSGGSSMAPSNVVMGCFDDTANADNDNPDEADFSINGRISPAQNANQGLLNYTQVTDGNCAFRFTRPLTPADVPETEHLTDRDQRTIAAFGGDDLAQHAGNARVAFDVNFATGENNDASSIRVTSVSLASATIAVWFSLL